MKPSLVFCFFVLAGCSSAPKVEKPAWISEPTRIVDNGYIVYVGTAEDMNPEKAQFRAEGIALEDLANECSFIPKGTRIEDRYRESEKSFTKAYVKIGLEFTACEKAKQSSDPTAIKEIANVAFTEQVRKYQDFSETGTVPDSSDYAELEVPKDLPPVPARTASMNGDTHFYVVRQYVAYQKEVVILSPPTAYAANSVESQHFISAIQPASAQIATYQQANPDLVKKPEAWSKVPNRGLISRPGSLAAPKMMKAAPARGYKEVPTSKRSPQNPPSNMKKKKRKHL
jgi:hypothetical protein